MRPTGAWSACRCARATRACDPDDYGLAEVEQEIWRGFVFVRFAPGLPSVADQMAPYAAELAGAPLEDLVPLGPPRVQTRHVNWKNVADNYSDGLHIPVAHPGLMRIFGKSYAIEAREWVDKMSGELVEHDRRTPPSACTRSSCTTWASPKARSWAYYKLWPNAAIELYPDQIDFMQFIPVTPTETQLRYINYGLPDERREMKAARYLNWRINRLVNLEDKDLIERVQAGMASSSYTVGPLGEGEVCLRSFGRRMRALFPGGARGHAAAEGLEHQPQGAAAPVSGAARKPRYERQVASDRREALVDAAIESLKRYGYEGLSVRRIAAEAGVSIGLINHHFPNKDTLVAESYRTFSRRLAANFESGGRGRRPRPAHAAAGVLRRVLLGPEPRPAGADRLGRVLEPGAGVAGDARGARRRGPGLQRGARQAAVRPRAHARRRARGPRARRHRADALLDGLWLQLCLDPTSIRPKDAAALCDDWVDRMVRPLTSAG